MKEKEEKMATGRVARGRTVTVPHPTDKIPCGVHPVTHEPMFAPRQVDHGPGSEITLPAADIAWLREHGFLVDPNKVIAASDTNGPVSR